MIKGFVLGMIKEVPVPVKLTITFEHPIAEYMMRTANPDHVEIMLDDKKQVMEVQIKQMLDPAGLNLFVLTEQILSKYPEIMAEPTEMLSYFPTSQSGIVAFTITDYGRQE